MERASLGPFLVEVARTRRDRRRGLLGRAEIPPGTGILFPGARSVHTVGMRFPITVAFLDATGRVVSGRLVPPNRIVANRRAAHALEVGALEHLQVGTRLEGLGSVAGGRPGDLSRGGVGGRSRRRRRARPRRA